MKKVWIAEWEVVPGDGVHMDQLTTFADAKKAMREKIKQTLDLKKYISWLRAEEEVDCKAAADFLEKYLTDPDFPYTAADVPVGYEDPDACELYFSPKEISWDYWYDECPRLHTNIVLEEITDDCCEFHFWYEHPENLGSVPNVGLSIKIYGETIWGTSAYPLMVWEVLRKDPQTQEQIILNIWRRYGIAIDRKTVGRHLKLLEKLGFPVKRSSKGYYYDGEFRSPEPCSRYGTSAYPLMVLRVLDGTPHTQAGIIQKIYEQYGTKMDRKAVNRHIMLLREIGYKVK